MVPWPTDAPAILEKLIEHDSSYENYQRDGGSTGACWRAWWTTIYRSRAQGEWASASQANKWCLAQSACWWSLTSNAIVLKWLQCHITSAFTQWGELMPHSSRFPGLFLSPAYSLCPPDFSGYAGYAKLPPSVRMVPLKGQPSSSRAYSHLAHSLPGVDWRSSATLIRMKQLLKMNKRSY